MTLDKAEDCGQAEGPIGRLVEGMIRRAVKRQFHGVWWLPPPIPVEGPAIFVPNHHGWHDGYLMYHAVRALNCRSLDWIEEFGAFPLFRYVGGMPFGSKNPTERGQTIRKTIRLMKGEKRSLILFAEGILHRPPEVMTFGKSLELLCAKVPEAKVYPVAIKYELSLHERPEAYVVFGDPIPAPAAKTATVRLEVKSLLDRCELLVGFERERLQLLAQGTPDVNERWDMRKAPWSRKTGTG